MRKLILIIAMVQAGCLAQAQNKLADRLAGGGDFDLGMRTSVSFFNDAGYVGQGVGGQFRLRILERLNTEWYADILATNIGNVGTRKDMHIGWSVMFYMFNTERVKGKFTPYIIAGHCFDGSHVFENRDHSNSGKINSSAVQMGLGTSYNITDNFDLTLTVQYMNHLGGHMHSEIYTDPEGYKRLNIERSSKTDFDGHLLVNLSLNVKLFDFWK